MKRQKLVKGKINNTEKKPKNNLLILTGVLVLAIFVLVCPMLIKEYKNFERYLSASLTNTSTASVTVGNVLPIASTVHINATDGTITLTEGSLTNKFTVTGTVTDANGCTDLASVTVKVYKGSLGDCNSTNYDTCYILTDSSPSTDGSCGAPPDTTFAVNGTNFDFEVAYYAQPGTWHATVIPSDHVGAATDHSNETSPGSTVSTTTALEVTSTIAYGNVANGSNSNVTDDSNKAIVTDTGNTQIDFQLSGADLSCPTSGNSIPVTDEQYNLGSNFTYGSGTALTAGSPIVHIDADMAAPSNSTYTTDTFATYWQVTVPYGVNGTCSGNVTFTAEAWQD